MTLHIQQRGPKGKLPQRMSGGCQCGACRYEISSAPLFGYVCHCRECRRQSAGLLSASIIVKLADFSVSGPVKVWKREDDTGSPLEASFCKKCGVRLFHNAIPNQNVIRVKVGTLDDPEWFRPAAEFFTSRRYPWVHFDGEPAQEVGPGTDYEAMMAVWNRLFTVPQG